MNDGSEWWGPQYPRSAEQLLFGPGGWQQSMLGTGQGSVYSGARFMPPSPFANLVPGQSFVPTGWAMPNSSSAGGGLFGMAAQMLAGQSGTIYGGLGTFSPTDAMSGGAFWKAQMAASAERDPGLTRSITNLATNSLIGRAGGNEGIFQSDIARFLGEKQLEKYKERSDEFRKAGMDTSRLSDEYESLIRTEARNKPNLRRTRDELIERGREIGDAFGDKANTMTGMFTRAWLGATLADTPEFGQAMNKLGGAYYASPYIGQAMRSIAGAHTGGLEADQLVPVIRELSNRIGNTGFNRGLTSPDVGRVAVAMAGRGLFSMEDVEGKSETGIVDPSKTKAAISKTMDRLKNYNEIVSSLRDVFGQNAPVDQLFKSLDAMTGGGMFTRSPAELRSLVDRMKNLSIQAGITPQEGAGIMVQAENNARQMGMGPGVGGNVAIASLAVRAVQQDLTQGLPSRFRTAGEDVQRTFINAVSQFPGSQVGNAVTGMLSVLDGVSDEQLKKTSDGQKLLALRNSMTKSGGAPLTGEQLLLLKQPSVIARMASRAAGVDENLAASVITWGDKTFQRDIDPLAAAQAQFDLFLPEAVRGNPLAMKAAKLFKVAQASGEKSITAAVEKEYGITLSEAKLAFRQLSQRPDLVGKFHNWEDAMSMFSSDARARQQTAIKSADMLSRFSDILKDAGFGTSTAAGRILDMFVGESEQQKILDKRYAEEDAQSKDLTPAQRLERDEKRKKERAGLGKELLSQAVGGLKTIPFKSADGKTMRMDVESMQLAIKDSMAAYHQLESARQKAAAGDPTMTNEKVEELRKQLTPRLKMASSIMRQIDMEKLHDEMGTATPTDKLNQIADATIETAKNTGITAQGKTKSGKAEDAAPVVRVVVENGVITIKQDDKTVGTIPVENT